MSKTIAPAQAIPDRKGLFLVYFAVAVALLSAGYVFRNDLQRVLYNLEAVVGILGPAAPIAMVVVCGIWGALCLPGPLMQAAVGTLFSDAPLVALAVVVSGEGLAQAIAFSLARFFGRERVREKLQQKPWFGRLESQTETRGTYGVFLFRLMPFFPNALGSYAFGLTSLRFWPYLGASVLGSVPKMVAYVYGTTSIAKLFRAGSLTASDLMVMVVLVALLGLAGRGLQIFLRRRASKPRLFVDKAAQGE